MRVRLRIFLIVGCLFAAFASAPRADAMLELQPVGTFNSPIFVTSTPGDSRLFVVERPGRIRVVQNGTTLPTPFLDITSLVNTPGEEGLISMAFDPNFASNGLFYVFFNDNGTAGAPTPGDIHIDEFRVTSNPNVVDPATRRPVLTIERGNSSTTSHTGGQLQFGKDGLLYISVGDATNSANSQSTANLNGKILRIDPHGTVPGAYSIPAGNPYAGGPGADEIWNLGLRNPYRFSIDHLTGDLVIADVGQVDWEEIDFAPTSAGLGGGANYGWPDCEGFSGYPASCPGSVAPVFAYPHTGSCTAVIGGYVYRGNQIPELAGRYVYTDFCHHDIRSMQLGLPLAADDRSVGLTTPLSPVSFGEDSSCELYLAASDEVEKIVSTNPPAVTPACPQASTVAKKKKKCTHRKKHRKHASSAKKKHKKKHCKRKRKKKK